MLLYLIYDSVNNTYSTPLISYDVETVQAALETLNPENLSSLHIIPITNFSDTTDLLKLRIDHSIDITPVLSNYEVGRKLVSPTQQP